MSKQKALIDSLTNNLKPSKSNGNVDLLAALWLLLSTSYVGFLLLRGLSALYPAQNALFIGLAAGMIPALYMQIACMYEPTHILKFHVLPGLSVGFAALMATYGWLKLSSNGEYRSR